VETIFNFETPSANFLVDFSQKYPLLEGYFVGLLLQQFDRKCTFCHNNHIINFSKIASKPNQFHWPRLQLRPKKAWIKACIESFSLALA